jgi:hypothetical protein
MSVGKIQMFTDIRWVGFHLLLKMCLCSGGDFFSQMSLGKLTFGRLSRHYAVEVYRVTFLAKCHLVDGHLADCHGTIINRFARIITRVLTVTDLF